MFDNIKIPEDIDKYITKGIDRGRRKMAAKRIKMFSAVMGSLLLVMFITGIRVSPVFASNVARIPGLNYIVELVGLDKGLSAAVENEYIQHIDKSVEYENIKFTIKDVIADNSGIIVFYSLENKGSHIMPRIRDVKLTDSKGADLKMSIGYDAAQYEGKNFEGKIEFYSNENQSEGIPDNLVLKVGLEEQRKLKESEISPKDNTPEQNTGMPGNLQAISGSWQIPFTIDREKLSGAEKMYNINQTVEVEGQKIKFEDIRIYPIKSILSVSLDPANTKKLFTFEDLKLMDENGEEWGRIVNGLSGSNPGGDRQTLNFQSNYFTKPKELYITGNYIRALDKDKCYFTVDTANGKILYSPFNLLSLTDITVGKDQMFLSAEMKRNAPYSDKNFSITNEAFDSNGHPLTIISEGMEGGDESSCYYHYNLKLGSGFKGPVTFKLCDYPSRISGRFTVKIPLDGK
ncbi:DUF4179 domain-containing protein [Ruminiclostridium cellobioparum]|uniref:DUF4179 domain-containing protein n=1 Tax=Ruminiclostridium cellobioparum subsp. termitidis CT1112 TaxID=1195236 RepID=S0FJY9_RUMCE|nr:DUF4179 domain-containing protein [Ruminiclostridium cellobioparum]EMS69449.1 hypothetical protein CTER_4557 [Ruminiclostridium cellobioparum subsp. termitidis CT1112]